MAAKMKAAVFVEPGRIVLEDKPIPDIGPLDALIRITTTTICGTDIHILKGEYPVAKGLTIGHEPVGVIEKLGSAVRGYHEGQRVIAGAITPAGTSYASLCGFHSQCGGQDGHGWKAIGGWRFGNTIDGAQAEYLRVPDAMANLAPVPDRLSDEQVLMCPDIMSTGIGGVESGSVKIGDSVAVFAQGPIGLCATAGAFMMGATTIIGVESVPERMAMARKMGATHVIDFSKVDPVDEIRRITAGRGVDVAIEAASSVAALETAYKITRPGGTTVTVSLTHPTHTFNLPATNLVVEERTLKGSFLGSAVPQRDLPRYIALYKAGRLPIDKLVTHRIKLDEINLGFDRLANGQAIRQVIVF